ncbi:IS3 family transposase [Marinifilum fragile]|uniref:IS3 family transposase n=1 Tax=Marinifilum fragile TaxID=570161 RepID=UPI002AA8ECA1|nr:IS3 family transposase [Marinifilum fragile]
MKELRQHYHLSLLLQQGSMARSSFYYHLKSLQQVDKYEQVKLKIQEIYHKYKGRYGYRRITLALKHLGFCINHKTVSRLMSELGLKSRIRIKKYKSYRGKQGKTAPNLLARDFKADGMYQKWVTDITEFKVAGQKLYLSPILDLYNREIISYQLSESPNFKQVACMLKKAFRKLPKQKNLLLHSDQGWQYQMPMYQKMLQKKKIRQSMSRKGNCLDNSVVENFFGTLKSELFYLKKYKTIRQLKIDIEEYIQYYNKERISLALNGMSPIKYRAHFQN